MIYSAKENIIIRDEEDIFNLFSKDEIQQEFINSIIEFLENQDYEARRFYCFYMGKYISKEERLWLEEVPASYVFKKVKNKDELINLFLKSGFNFYLNYTYMKLGLDRDIAYSIPKSINEKVFNELDYDNLANSFEEAICDFLDRHNDELIETLKKYELLPSQKVNLDELHDLKIEIGETYKIKQNIDYQNRNSAFIDIDGLILISNSGESHSEILQKYLDKISEDKKFEDDWTRPKDEEIEKYFNPQYSIFGHIYNDDIFVESKDIKKLSIDTVLNDLDNAEINYNRLFVYSNDYNEVTRVAKRI